MWSIDGSGRADTLLLKRIGVEYRDTTVLRLKHWASVVALEGTIHYTIAAQNNQSLIINRI